ncbi:hypothetical protein MNBD_GAMMA16-436 [hydrothermal vent metagenome]|uniref:NHL repeat domain protein n=1 Tax=hydrothermal vent metagenome TaxID=652676 RepID=A0A3B0Z6L3_9ZZZZ
MSFRTSQISWLALKLVINVNFFEKRQSLAGLLAGVCIVLILNGCAVGGWLSFESPPKAPSTTETSNPNNDPLIGDAPELLSLEIDEEKEPPLVESPPVTQEVMPLLEFVESIDGGVIHFNSKIHDFMQSLIGVDRLQLMRPTAVAVRDGYMYVVDMGLDLVIRFDLATKIAEPLVELSGITKGDVADIFVAGDGSFYLTDTEGARVLHFSPKGKLKRTLKNRLNMARPVAVYEESSTGNIYIADGFFDHVLAFNRLGELFTSIGGRGSDPGEFLNITAMTLGPDGFYIGSRVGQHVQVLKGNGEYLYSLEQGPLVFPLGMAATDDSRVYVSDYWDNSIKVFERGLFVDSVGGTGVTPGKFKRITDLYLDKGLLYAVDSLNGRVQVLRVQEKEQATLALDY